MEYKLVLFLALIIAVVHCSHFRGGTISWTVPANSTSVTFSIQASFSKGTAANFSFSPGDGATLLVVVSSANVIKANDYETVYSTLTYDYKKTGKWVAYYMACCRLETLRAGANQTYRVSSLVKVSGVYDSSTTLSFEPVVNLGVGTNSIPIVSTFGGTFGWSSNADSMLLTYVGGIFTGASISAPTIAPSATLNNVGILSWTTGKADLGMWAVQVQAVTKTSTVVADFILMVNDVSTSTNVPQVKFNPDQISYALTTGDKVSFSVTCTTPTSGAPVTLYIPASYGTGTGAMYLGGKVQSAVNTTTGTPIAFSWTPVITNGAKNQYYTVTFVCRSTTSYLSSSASVAISVGAPLVLTVPGSVTLPCHPACGCVDLGTATATDGCCGIPAISYVDTDSPNNSCNSQYTRIWTAANICGQSVSKNQTIYLNDKAAPYFVTDITDVTVQCYAQADPTLFDKPFAEDACGGPTNVNSSDKESNPGSNCKNTITRTYVATDECGNANTTVQYVTVNDDVPPFVTVNTENPLEVECPSEVSVFDNIITAIDCDVLDAGHIQYVDSVKTLPACGSWVRTWTATDLCGNTASLDTTLKVWHTEKPTITLNDAYNSPQCVTDVDYLPAPTARSYCGLTLYPKLISSKPDGGSCCKTVTRTWAVADECDITAEISEVIHVDDNTPPILDIPDDYTVGCSAGYPDGVNDDLITPQYAGQASAKDNCGNVTVTYKDTRLTSSCAATINRAWTAVDSCGNTVTKIQKIYVKDNSPPDFVVTDYYGQCPADVKNIITPIPTDCHKATISYNDAQSTYSNYKTCKDGTYIRNWNAEDSCGNCITKKQYIYIKDTTPPIIHVPCNSTVECANKATTDRTGVAHATDNCILTGMPTYVDTVLTNMILRNWTIADDCGNIDWGIQYIFVNDSLPKITVPANTSVVCMSASSPAKTGYATANDQCAGYLKTTYNDTITGTCPTVIVRTWSVYDFLSKSTVSTVQTITVGHPKQGPTIHAPADAKGFQCDAEINCTGKPCVSVICDEDSYDVTYTDSFPADVCSAHVVTRTWTATDQCGASASAKQLIYVKDTTPPVLVVPPACTMKCNAYASPDYTGYAKASDNCGGKVILNYTDSPNTPCPKVITRTWTATDCAGNVATKPQTITVAGDAPVWNGNPPSKLPTAQCPGEFKFPNLTATDYCGNIIPATYKITSSGSCPTIYTVTWTASDSCGRSSTFVQTMLVNDTIPPEVSYVPAEVTVECDSQGTSGITVRDNCPGVGLPMYTEKLAQNPDCPCDTCHRSIYRFWYVVDKCGLKSEFKTQHVISVKTTPPIITSPPNYSNCNLQCGDSSTGSTGNATAKDSCGHPLPVYYRDETVTSAYDGSIRINRYWNATDDCGQTSTKLQTICLKQPKYDTYTDDQDYVPKTGYYKRSMEANYGKGDNSGYRNNRYRKNDYVCVPPPYTAPCGGDYSVQTVGYGQAYSQCGDVYTNYTEQITCPTRPGDYSRQYNVYRNDYKKGKVLVHTAYHSITVQNCKSTATTQIYNLPTTPQLRTEAFTPKITISDPDLPCDVITVVWKWGDDKQDTITCDPTSPSAGCVYNSATKTIEISYSHIYNVAGAFTIEALVYDQRTEVPAYLTDGVNYGDGWSRYYANVVTYDEQVGSVTGDFQMTVITTDNIYYKDSDAWVCKGPGQQFCVAGICFEWGGYSDRKISGNFKVSFSASFLYGAGGKIYSVGTTSFDNGAGISFKSINHTRLTMYAPSKTGLSAYWTGFGTFSIFPNVVLPFYVYIVDGNTPSSSKGDAFRIRITDQKSVTVFDTSPGTGNITNFPVSVISANSVGCTIRNPPSTPISAVTDNNAFFGGQPAAFVIGIIVGLVVFAGIVAAIVFLLIRRTANEIRK